MQVLGLEQEHNVMVEMPRSEQPQKQTVTCMLPVLSL